MAEDEPLFIVDNAPGGRSGLEYLREWCELASTFDVATGFFDIGALLALDGDWQKLEGMRVLMGDEVSRSTRKALLEAVRKRAEARLDDSIEEAKREDPFLEGADAVVEALATSRIACRVYNRDKFHAKAYITHGRFEVVGSQALVGSSNFTKAGLTQNVELNLKIESSAEVAQLQRWYEAHWNAAVDVTADLLRTVQRHTAEFTPFDVYAKALQALVSTREARGAGWDHERSRMRPKLDRYQQEADAALTGIAGQHGGALLCDGVGLGKTYVGLMLIERLVLRDGKRVVLLAPKAVREGVWEKELRAHLAHIGGFGGTGDFSNLTVFNHTDLTRSGDFPERFTRVAELADAIVIDEAHHFRNRGRRSDEDDPSTWSRYHRLAALINGGGRTKQVFLLTATPINNSLNDFRHLVELFTDGDDAHFSRTLGVSSVNARLNALTREVRGQVGGNGAVPDAPDVMHEVLAGDPLFQGLVVQRSRAYARQSQLLEKGEATVFPERKPPQVAGYSLRDGHGRLLELIDDSFQREKPLFSLAIYYPLARQSCWPLWRWDRRPSPRCTPRRSGSWPNCAWPRVESRRRSGCSRASGISLPPSTPRRPSTSLAVIRRSRRRFSVGACATSAKTVWTEWPCSSSSLRRRSSAAQGAKQLMRHGDLRSSARAGGVTRWSLAPSAGSVALSSPPAMVSGPHPTWSARSPGSGASRCRGRSVGRVSCWPGHWSATRGSRPSPRRERRSPGSRSSAPPGTPMRRPGSCVRLG
jgi:hypothetical protein